jgi:hypothetical protein
MDSEPYSITYERVGPDLAPYGFESEIPDSSTGGSYCLRPTVLRPPGLIPKRVQVSFHSDIETLERA